MSINDKILSQISKLARLDETSTHNIQEDLNRIVKMVDQIQAVNTQGILPQSHPLDLPQPLRPDQVTEADQRDLLQTLAPVVEAGLYLVPPVIETESEASSE